MKDRIYTVYCPTCDDMYSIEDNEEDAHRMAWKHHWKTEEGHVREEDMIVSEYNKTRDLKVDYG